MTFRHLGGYVEWHSDSATWEVMTAAGTSAGSYDWSAARTHGVRLLAAPREAASSAPGWWGLIGERSSTEHAAEIVVVAEQGVVLEYLVTGTVGGVWMAEWYSAPTVVRAYEGKDLLARVNWPRKMRSRGTLQRGWTAEAGD